MNFELNRLHNHRNRLDFIMMESEEEVSGTGTGTGTVTVTGGGGEMEKEHMFDKVVTPSDVGKLNRLVIPKQHAERFFPLDSSTNEKGLLLNFEDRNGKSWRFRYSYWNSSQSYVMTKGWSRFVKEKRLDAGDIVSFQRGVGEIGRDRLYIDWRRRPELPIDHHHHHHHHSPGAFLRPSVVVPAAAATTPWGSLVWRPLNTAATGYHNNNNHPAAVSLRDHAHLSSQIINGNNNINMVYDWNRGGYGSVESGVVYLRGEGRRVAPRLRDDDEEEGNYQVQQQEYCRSDNGGGVGSMVVHGNYEHHLKPTTTNYNNSELEGDHDTPVKRSRLRLFGVNMECPISTSSANSSDDQCDLLLSSSNYSNHLKTTTIIPTTPSTSPPPHPHQR